MKSKVVVPEEKGGYWAKVPSLPGCYTQGETFEEWLANIYEAAEAYLSVDMEPEDEEDRGKGRVVEIAV